VSFQKPNSSQSRSKHIPYPYVRKSFFFFNSVIQYAKEFYISRNLGSTIKPMSLGKTYFTSDDEDLEKRIK
jgi:hypothetical protein